jgi:hypothetical protein
MSPEERVRKNKLYINAQELLAANTEAIRLKAEQLYSLNSREIRDQLGSDQQLRAVAEEYTELFNRERHIRRIIAELEFDLKEP